MSEPKKFFAMGENIKTTGKKSGGLALKDSSEKFIKSVEEQIAKQDAEAQAIPELKLEPVAGTKNRVFVNPVKPKQYEVRESGIVTVNKLVSQTDEPDKKWEKYGTVLSVTERDETGVLPNVKVGDVVYFDFNYKEEEFEGITYLVMKEGNIYARLKNEPNGK